MVATGFWTELTQLYCLFNCLDLVSKLLRMPTKYQPEIDGPSDGANIHILPHPHPHPEEADIMRISNKIHKVGFNQC